MGQTRIILDSTLLFCNFNNIIVTQAIQICLRNLDILMPQEPGNGIEVSPHFNLLLRKEMAASMRRYADTFNSRSIAFYNVFYCTIGKLPPMKG